MTDHIPAIVESFIKHHNIPQALGLPEYVEKHRGKDIILFIVLTSGAGTAALSNVDVTHAVPWDLDRDIAFHKREILNEGKEVKDLEGEAIKRLLIGNALIDTDEDVDDADKQSIPLSVQALLRSSMTDKVPEATPVIFYVVVKEMSKDHYDVAQVDACPLPEFVN